MNKQRIDKIISNCGLGSRKEIKKYIKDGYVSVNGEIKRSPEFYADPQMDKILFKDIPLKYKKYIYLMMNKPQGVITATEDKREKTFMDLLPEFYHQFNLSAAGRLDKDTEGLLILTDDGQGIHKLISPKRHVDKVYYARLETDVKEEYFTQFEIGIDIGGYITMPAKLMVCNENSGKLGKEVYLTIQEGKFHQVKRMFEALGNKVMFLKRISIGRISLDPDLELGQIRELTEEEEEMLYE